MTENEELLSVLPHRGRMLLLSRINGYSPEERSLEAEYHITENCLFFDPAAAGVPAWVGFELMAQAVSALSGITGRERGEKPKIGFILSISAVRIGLPFFKAGSTVKIKVKETDQMDLIYAFSGEIFLEDKKVVTGKLMVMDVDNEQAETLKKEHTGIG